MWNMLSNKENMICNPLQSLWIVLIFIIKSLPTANNRFYMLIIFMFINVIVLFKIMELVCIVIELCTNSFFCWQSCTHMNSCQGFFIFEFLSRYTISIHKSSIRFIRLYYSIIEVKLKSNSFLNFLTSLITSVNHI